MRAPIVDLGGPPPLQTSPLARAAARFDAWRAASRLSLGWTLAVLGIAALVATPIAAVLIIALTGGTADWSHLAHHVLPRAIWQTVQLAIGVAVVSLVTGTSTAWLVTMYRFPGRALLDRLLVLPLAIPTYIVAYCYVDLLDYGGPVQAMVRSAGGYATARDYAFPEIRSVPGAIFVMSAVLYPYVYLSARASFVQQSVCVLEVARTLGQSAMGTFWRIALPLSRPALAAGTALVLMESLNDLGAVQYLGVETLSASIYATWLQRASLTGAAQIAALALLAVALILILERSARGASRYHHTTGRYRAIPFQDISGWRGWAAAGACAIPALLGFVVPILVLARHSFAHAEEIFSSEFLTAILHSATLSLIVASTAVTLALMLAYAVRIAGSRTVTGAVSMAGLGYAVPGTVLAIGVIIPFAAFDNFVDGLLRAHLDYATGLILSGTLAALAFALVVRFLAVALGSVESGLQKISPNLDAAARTLGATSLSTLGRVHLPLLLPALGAAALLVFIDTMKELPATLLLRPFNYETLATHVYALTALEQFERAAPGALAIVLAGLIPVLILHRAVATSRSGRATLL